MGWVNPWVGLGWVRLGLGPNLSLCNGLGWVQLKNLCFYSYVTGLYITYFLTVILNRRNHTHTSIKDGTVSYLDVHVSWINRQFQKHHAALAVRHFGHCVSYWKL